MRNIGQDIFNLQDLSYVIIDNEDIQVWTYSQLTLIFFPQFKSQHNEIKSSWLTVRICSLHAQKHLNLSHCFSSVYLTSKTNCRWEMAPKWKFIIPCARDLAPCANSALHTWMLSVIYHSALLKSYNFPSIWNPVLHHPKIFHVCKTLCLMEFPELALLTSVSNPTYSQY